MNFGCLADVFNSPTIGNTCSLAEIHLIRQFTAHLIE